MWFGSNGLRAVHFKQGRVTEYAVGGARSILVDGDTVWMAEGRGVARLRNGSLQVIPNNVPSGATATVWNLHKDAAGRVWAGTQGRLCEVTGDSLRCLSLPKTQHSDPPVMGMLDDTRGGGMWLGTWVGLFHFKDGVFRRYGAEAGLPEIRIMTVLEDAQGDLWLCTSNAILRITRATLDRFEAKQIPKLTYDTYDATHGMKSNQFEYDGTVGARRRTASCGSRASAGSSPSIPRTSPPTLASLP